MPRCSGRETGWSASKLVRMLTEGAQDIVEGKIGDPAVIANGPLGDITRQQEHWKHDKATAKSSFTPIGQRKLLNIPEAGDDLNKVLKEMRESIEVKMESRFRHYLDETQEPRMLQALSRMYGVDPKRQKEAPDGFQRLRGEIGAG